MGSNDEKFRILKIHPRNLTARAAYVVQSNPVTSRPESGVDNCYPGLEMDQRNLDQRFFPGLYFEFSREDGAILAGFNLTEPQKVSGLSARDFSLDEPFLLLAMYGRTQVADEKPRFFSFHQLSGINIGAGCTICFRVAWPSCLGQAGRLLFPKARSR